MLACHLACFLIFGLLICVDSLSLIFSGRHKTTSFNENRPRDAFTRRWELGCFRKWSFYYSSMKWYLNNRRNEEFLLYGYSSVSLKFSVPSLIRIRCQVNWKVSSVSSQTTWILVPWEKISFWMAQIPNVDNAPVNLKSIR